MVLRPTKVRGLYSQMVGRGTRLAPGKKDLLLLDFLWHTDRMDLCHPAHLICKSAEVAQKMTENLENEAENGEGGPTDIGEAEEQAEKDVVRERENALAEKLEACKKRKRKLVDPLQFEMSIQAEDLSSYVPTFGWEMGPPTQKQKAALERLGILPDEIENAGKAKLILDRLHKRAVTGLTTPKQIRCLEKYGFRHVGNWQFKEASDMITRIAANGWKVPHKVNAHTYQPLSIAATDLDQYLGWDDIIPV